MLASLIYYSNRLPTLPLSVEIRPTVVKSCLDLSCGGISYSGSHLLSRVGFKGAGGDTRELLGRWSEISCLGRRVEGWGLMNFLDGGPKIF